jgi:hypothetical protein
MAETQKPAPDSFADLYVGVDGGKGSSETTSVETALNVSVVWSEGSSVALVSNMDPLKRAPYKRLPMRVTPEVGRWLRAVLAHQKANRIKG